MVLDGKDTQDRTEPNVLGTTTHHAGIEEMGDACPPQESVREATDKADRYRLRAITYMMS
jgi:hypothetical protein